MATIKIKKSKIQNLKMELLTREQYKLFKKLNEENTYNKFNTTDGIFQPQVEPTKKHILKHLSYLFNLGDDDFSFVGSAGKLRDEQPSYNINVGINKNNLFGNNKVSQDTLDDFLKDRMKVLGYQHQISSEDNDDVYLLWDAQDPEEEISESKKETKKISVHCHLTENFDWLNFSRYCPNLKNGESEYPSKYKEVLLTSIVNESFNKKILEYFDLNDTVKEYEGNIFLPNKGLYKEIYTFSGKNGILKSPEALSNTKKLITNDPKKFTEMCFGEGCKLNETKIFENCMKKVKGKNFPYKKQRERILESCKNGLVSKRLEVPKELE